MVAFALGSLLVGSTGARAQVEALGNGAPSPTQVVPNNPSLQQTEPAQPRGIGDGVSAYFSDWFNRVDASLASQPIWAAPLVMATPRIVELFRYGLGHGFVRQI